MANFFFYTITVLIWGSTWLAIKFQLGMVDPALSVAYRFALAALMLFAWCFARRLPLRFSCGDHFSVYNNNSFCPVPEFKLLITLQIGRELVY